MRYHRIVPKETDSGFEATRSVMKKFGALEALDVDSIVCANAGQKCLRGGKPIKHALLCIA